MAHGLKTLGLLELSALARRVHRQHGLGRIWTADADYILDHLKAVEARIVEMHESENKYGGGEFDAGP